MFAIVGNNFYTNEKDPRFNEGLNQNLAPCYFPRGEPQVL